MNKFVKILAQFLFVILLDVLVIGWIYIESEKWEGIKAAAAAEAAIPEVQIDARSGFEIDPWLYAYSIASISESTQCSMKYATSHNRFQDKSGWYFPSSH